MDPRNLAKIIQEFTGKELSEKDIYDYAYFLKGSEDAFDDEKKERIRSDLASIVLHNPGLAEKVAEEYGKKANQTLKQRFDLAFIKSLWGSKDFQDFILNMAAGLGEEITKEELSEYFSGNTSTQFRKERIESKIHAFFLQSMTVHKVARSISDLDIFKPHIVYAMLPDGNNAAAPDIYEHAKLILSSYEKLKLEMDNLPKLKNYDQVETYLIRTKLLSGILEKNLDQFRSQTSVNTSTILLYQAGSLDGQILHYYMVSGKEMIIRNLYIPEVYVNLKEAFSGPQNENVLHFLQELFLTKDDAATMCKTLSFLFGRKEDEITLAIPAKSKRVNSFRNRVVLIPNTANSKSKPVSSINCYSEISTQGTYFNLYE